ncbi:MAG: ATP-NAD kinase family protein, partial [Nitrososphaerales archaeon]
MVLESSKKRIGFIVNPYAGMGGKVGLKGTDGDALKKALELGAKPIAPKRAVKVLKEIKRYNLPIEIITYPCEMGEYEVIESGFIPKVIGSIESGKTTASDTIRAAKEILSISVDLLLFVGGDGTARDILNAINQKLPVLGVPSGVKTYSSVFAINPSAAASIVVNYLQGRLSIGEGEVLDIDEDAYRRGVLNVKLYGFLKIPVFGEMVQSSKTVFSSYNEEENKIGIAKFVIENLSRDTLLILGPGSTVKKIAELLSQPYTLMGFDAYYDGKVVGLDLSEKELFDLINRYNRKVLIVLSPIGGQGFILGRGNQQLSP